MSLKLERRVSEKSRSLITLSISVSICNYGGLASYSDFSIEKFLLESYYNTLFSSSRHC